ncbi:MBL fold metallo-hydrolase [Oceanicoccus sagamiensis]|uniref:MBL fold metallo-hydrolase n=1 Tax=Oceanicoccus sagamiensis TaxID=716816 RepID=A0A1X9NGW6_9GAMM|nr:MBL fold metallo-hydrolase [Oceanicoccus sagamiensis]
MNDSITLLQGKGGNIAVSHGSDGLLIIDDDYADMSDSLKQQLAELGGGSELKYILNTHWHSDHTGSNDALGKGVAIVAHDNVRKRLSSPQEVPFFNMVTTAQAKHALPSLTYPDAMNIHFNDESIRLEHYPNGHTDGDSVVFFESSNVVHMGDHMFYPMFPFVDISSDGNVVNFANNVGKVLAKVNDATVVIPGHGPLTDKKGLTTYHQMLMQTIAEVKAMKAEGLSVKQAQARGLSPKWQEWNGGFIKQENYIAFIYQSL